MPIEQEKSDVSPGERTGTPPIEGTRPPADRCTGCGVPLVKWDGRLFEPVYDYDGDITRLTYHRCGVDPAWS